MDGMGGMITARQFLRERKQQEAEATRAWRLQPDDPLLGKEGEAKCK